MKILEQASKARSKKLNKIEQIKNLKNPQEAYEKIEEYAKNGYSSIPDEDKTCIECWAVATWQKKEDVNYLTGIEFMNLDINQQLLIKTFVSKSISETTRRELP